jgi:hypothetical protein
MSSASVCLRPMTRLKDMSGSVCAGSGREAATDQRTGSGIGDDLLVDMRCRSRYRLSPQSPTQT